MNSAKGQQNFRISPKTREAKRERMKNSDYNLRDLGSTIMWTNICFMRAQREKRSGADTYSKK